MWVNCVTHTVSVDFFFLFFYFFIFLFFLFFYFFFFNDTATTEIYTLSLHDALPICDALFMRTFDPILALN